MAEYIERKMALAVLAEEEKACDFDALDGLYIAEDCISKVPAADVAPVRHGQWLLKHIGAGHMWECSCCHQRPCIYITEDTAYCPNCGAKMDGALW